MVRFALAAVAALTIAFSTQAAPLKIGEAAPQFSGLESASGKVVSIDDYKDKDVLVVCFTCNHCPVAKAYEDRLMHFAKEYGGKDAKVGVLAINVNNIAEDKLDKMKERAKEKGYTFEYAYDPTQKIARDLGATKTPEFFVFDKARKLVYTGAYDDNMKAQVATKHYVEDAVKATLKGEKVAVETTKPEGCGIKFDKK